MNRRDRVRVRRTVIGMIVATVFVIGTFCSASAAGSFSYVDYAEVLAKHVSDRGSVNYAALQANPEKLDDFIRRLAAVDPEAYAKWTSSTRIAFWINAYNALTLKTVLERVPPGQLKKIESLAPPEGNRQSPGGGNGLQFNVMGRSMTLDQIENEVLRTQFQEPRIHMALACATADCPSLRNEPYTAGRLSDQLNDQTRRFLADTTKFQTDPAKKTLYLSPLFKRYGPDFERSYGVSRKPVDQTDAEAAVINFILRYLKGETRDFVAAGGYKIEYLDDERTLK